MSKSLKEQNRPLIASVVVANFVAFAALLATSMLALGDLSFDTEHLKPFIPAGLTLILGSLITDQFSPNAKARIVFWRWHHPLPASQAFSVIGPQDSRVDMHKVEQTLGQLPSNPAAQNRTWFDLYKKVEDETSVHEAHKRYLFNRDYACLSLVFLFTMGPLALWRIESSQTAHIYFAALLIQYFVARRAAAQTGRRFVANVLASCR